MNCICELVVPSVSIAVTWLMSRQLLDNKVQCKQTCGNVAILAAAVSRNTRFTDNITQFLTQQLHTDAWDR